MKGKKFVLSLLVTVSIFACLAFVACNNTDESTHEHTYSSAWTSDETYHWHVATCGHDVISGKAEHIWDGGVVTKEPTCTEKGEKTYTCTVCDKTKKEEIAASGHTFSDEWESNETHHWHPSTCGHDVVSDKAEHTGNPCTVCGYENIPEHKHSLEYHAAKPVTCTENGNIEYWECSGCHKYFSDEQGETEIADKNSVNIVTEGHKWGEWETVKQATCTEEGEKQRICSRCFHSETETLPVKAHTYDGYIKNSEYHWQKCSVCQNESEREPHNFVEGICSVCNYDSRYSWELDFTLTGDYYTVTGIGDCTDKEIKIPESYEGKPVKAIAANAFWGQTGITSLKIPKSIESTGNNAFQNCTGLEEISIENKDIELGAGAFLGCEKITWASLPAFVVSEIAVTNLKILFVTDGELENAVLSDAKNLVSLTVPDITTTLGAVFGANTDVLESLTLTETTEIAEYAFKDFTALKEINLPEGINSIGADAFLNTAYYNDGSNWVFNVLYLDSYLLKANTQITGHYPINNETTVIADAAFSSCNGLTSIVISDNVKTIGNNAFENCSGLMNFSIPDSVMSIGSDAFSGCSNLIKIETDVENPNYFSQDGILYSRKNTEFVHIPAKLQGDITIADGIISIFDNAFSGRSGLTGVIIPDSVTGIGSSAFEGCSGLTDIIVPDSVTNIGYSAFSGCDGLTQLTLPFTGANKNENTHLGYIFGAKSYNDSTSYVPENLKTVIISGSIISNYAFYNCDGLLDIIICDKTTSIGNYAFYNCSGLTSATIPDNVTSIGKYAFSGCNGLASITIPDSVTSIEEYAFSGCSGLTSVTIGNGVTSIGNFAFSDCNGLASITIPDSVTSIGDSAFSGCSGLTSVTIGNGVTSIGESAFYGCSGLTSVIIPDSVTSIGESAFSGCSGLTSVIIPDSVTSIGEFAFSGCSGLTSITIPDSVTSIGRYAFVSCIELTSITIPDSVTSIGSSAFRNCSRLTSITIPFVGEKADGSGKTHFGYIFGASFYSYNDDYVPASLKEVIITGGTSIGNSAFEDCSGLTSVTIPDSVASIGSSAFSGCSGLTSITIPESVSSIEESAFKYCSGLTSITIPFVGGKADGSGKTHFGYIFGAGSYSDNSNRIPANLKEVIITGSANIGDYAFKDCSGLTSITIPNSVTSIGSLAFDGCSGLTNIYYTGDIASWCGTNGLHNLMRYIDANKTLYIDNQEVAGNLTIPAGTTSIGNCAFFGCSGLTGIAIPNSVTSIGYSAFSNCRGLTSIIIPNSVTSIGNSAFSGCSGLTSIIIPNSVTSIGESAFSGCSGLTSVTIPDSVTSIEFSAFSGCNGLTSATFENPNDWWYSSSSTATSGTSILSSNLSDPGTAAKYLKQIYCSFYWKRS